MHKLSEKKPDMYFFCDQYANDNNWLAHYHGTAEEMIQHLNGKAVVYFVGGVGGVDPSAADKGTKGQR